MKNILVPIDIRAHSEEILKSAIQIANCVKAKTWLLHIVMSEPEFLGYDIGPEHERDWRSMELRGEHQYLHQKAIEMDRQGVEVVYSDNNKLLNGKVREKLIQLSTHNHYVEFIPRPAIKLLTEQDFHDGYHVKSDVGLEYTKQLINYLENNQLNK